MEIGLYLENYNNIKLLPLLKMGWILPVMGYGALFETGILNKIVIELGLMSKHSVYKVWGLMLSLPMHGFNYCIEV